MNTTDNISDLAYQLYEKHQKAIDLIFEARELYRNIRWDGVETVVQQYAPDLQFVSQIKNLRRYFPRSLDEIDGLKKGCGWTTSTHLLLFEFEYAPKNKSLYLRLVMGAGPEATRQLLYDVAN